MKSKTNFLFNQKLWVRILSLVCFIGIFNISNAQTVTINGPTTGTTGFAPLGTSNFHSSEHIYLQSEINTAMSIDFIKFNCTTLGISNFTNVAIYMKTSSATTFSASTYGTPTTGFTLVYSGTMNWTAVGFQGVNLTTPFNYTNLPNENLHVLVIRTDNALHTGAVFASCQGNATNSAATTVRRFNSTTPPLSTSAWQLSNFRAQIQLGHTLNNDMAVSNVYTLGKMPIEYAAPTVIRANVTNNSAVALTNVPVTCNITGANSFTDIQTIPSIAAGASTVVSFAGYSPATQSVGDVVTVSVPSDDLNSNNAASWSMDVTSNTYSYKNQALPNASGVGFNGVTGDFVAKFKSNIGQNYPFNITSPEINEIKVDFFAGGQPYQLGIWDATGAGGTPGTLLWQSASATSVTGTAIIPVPDIPVTGDYFVGVRQIGTTNVSFAYQAESPIRSGTFYYTSPTGTTTWTDFAPASPFRFSIEVAVHIPVPPNCAINLLPANGSTTSCSNPVLSWGNGGGAPTGYDVYFSTNSTDVMNLNPSVLVSANQTGITYTPSVSPSTTYYWIIVPKNNDGDADACTMNSFTTGILPNCYCIPTHSPTCTGIISDVTMGTIANATSCTGDGYTIFPNSGTTTTSLEQSVTYNLSVTSPVSCIISVWIDYNQNGTFEPSEWTQVTTSSVANVASTIPIVIPATATLGNTMMRIRTRFAGSPNGDIDACTSFGSGETEDYIVNITPQQPCAGTPNPGATVSSSTLACLNSTVNLSLQNAIAGLGVTYQWYSADDAGFTTNIDTLGTSTTQSATITANKYFRCKVTCLGSDGYSSPVLVSLNSDYCLCATYCAVSTPQACDEFITNVTFAGINNNSACNYPYIFNSNVSGAVTAGSTYPLIYTAAPFYTGDTVAVFFDWNQDGDFDDVGEAYGTSNLANGTASIGVPSNATTGSTRMRVRLAYAQTVNACGANDYSETEDYCITVSPGNSVLDLNALLECYIDPNISPSVVMRSACFNNGICANSTDADNIIVSLHTAPPALTQVASVNTVLSSGGFATCTFPPLNGNYYIRIESSNHITTWSSGPVAISGTPASYNFASAITQAAGSNMIPIPNSNLFAFFGGDFDHNGGVDNDDYTLWETDANDFNLNMSTDADGNGGVDNDDYPCWEVNAGNFISEVTP